MAKGKYRYYLEAGRTISDADGKPLVSLMRPTDSQLSPREADLLARKIVVLLHLHGHAFSEADIAAFDI